jgi:uncharacterized membrane protein HdeD (DUF308 family)
MRLKRWVKVVIEIILGISFIFMISECEDTAQFIVSHILATFIFIGCMLILTKFE